ncbi:MAG: zonular occludens toxin domain-containing protein [archaeon]
MPKSKKKFKKQFKETFTGKSLIFLAKTPIYLWRGAKKIKIYSDKKSEEKKVLKKRGMILAKYESFKTLQADVGDYNEWEKKVFNADSKIGIIIGARGTGKTAFGIRFIENLYSINKKRCYAIGFKKEEMPMWINVVQEINQLNNNSFVLIDEGGILFSSRSSMSNANKLLSELILIARHKNLSILFISQNSSNLDINILRQADFLILKPSSLLQEEFERKIIQKIYREANSSFNKFKGVRGVTHIYSDDFKGFIVNPLPSFWGEKISKGFS